MREIFQKLSREKQTVMLVMIVGADGSQPRGAGACMAVGMNGRLCGTIGGGILEYRAEHTAMQLLAQGRKGSFLCAYELSGEMRQEECPEIEAGGRGQENRPEVTSAEEIPEEHPEIAGAGRSPEEHLEMTEGGKTGAERLERVGKTAQPNRLEMICGGTVQMLYYPISPLNQTDREMIAQVQEAFASHERFWMLLPLEAGRIQVWRQSDAGMMTAGAKSRTILHMDDGTAWYVEEFGGDGCVYVFGGGHLAQETVPLLAHLGFRCIVLEDREEFARKELFPGAEQVCLVKFDKLVHSVHRQDYILIMTRGHSCDLEVERFALGTQAGYIGVVGSTRKAAFIREKLEDEGFSGDELDCVVSPVGLKIDSDTPAEIAVSIAAQLISVRAKKRKYTTIQPTARGWL